MLSKAWFLLECRMMSPSTGGRGYKHSCSREALALDCNHTLVSSESPLQSANTWGLSPGWPGNPELSELPEGLCCEEGVSTGAWYTSSA